MRTRVPECTARRWRQAKRLHKLATVIERACSPKGSWGWYMDENGRIHGHYAYCDAFVDELYDLVQRLRAAAEDMEGC